MTKTESVFRRLVPRSFFKTTRKYIKEGRTTCSARPEPCPGAARAARRRQAAFPDDGPPPAWVEANARSLRHREKIRDRNVAALKAAAAQHALRLKIAMQLVGKTETA